MRICIELEEFQRLSQGAREEILRLLSGSPAQVITGSGEEWEGPAELTPLLMKKFMDGVADTTKDLLKIFAENNGRASCSQLLTQSGYGQLRKLTGFFAGVTRRVRRILQDEEAYLLYWDESTAKYDNEDELLDGEYYMSNLSTESLKKYFGIY